MKNFFLIVGPIAVGKMTVGQELSKRLDIPLFYNHDSIELALKFGYYGTEVFSKINEGIRTLIFDSVAESPDAKGLIFTLVWDFADQRDWEYVEDLQHQFVSQGWRFHLIELSADLHVRQERNTSPNRLAHKLSKRDVARSQENLLRSEELHTMNSPTDLSSQFEHYCSIDSTHMEPSEVVQQIFLALHLRGQSD